MSQRFKLPSELSSDRCDAWPLLNHSQLEDLSKIARKYQNTEPTAQPYLLSQIVFHEQSVILLRLNELLAFSFYIIRLDVIPKDLVEQHR